jgi:predicted ATP-grasp superfamily ATP-dependent carboligase
MSARAATLSRTTTPAAIVIGLDSITGLQTARILASHGVPVVGVAGNPGHPSCRTNACARIVFTQTDGETLVDALQRLGPAFARSPVLFPCTDLSVLTLSRHREALAPWYKAVLPPPGIIELLLDKARFAEYATEARLPIAPTWVLRTEENVASAVEHLTFPCVVKPAVKTMTWHRHTSAKVFKASNALELRLLFRRCRPWAEALVAQEWIDGPDTRHFTCNAYFDSSSAPVVTFVSQKLRQWPLEGGVGCFSQECRNDPVLHETIRLFQRIGYHGLAYLELKLDSRTGQYLIIEPNVGRPTGRSACADMAGVPLLYAQYCDALGAPLPTTRTQRYEGAKWIYFRQDCQASFAYWRRGALRPSDWLRSLRGCRGDAVFAWRDPKPFVADMFHALGKAAGRRANRSAAVATAGAVACTPTSEGRDLDARPRPS